MDTKFPPRPQNAVNPIKGQSAASEALEVGHEVSDVNVKGLFIFAFALVSSIVVVVAGVAVTFGVFGFFNGKLDARRPAREPAAASLVDVPPDYHGPLLQVKPEQDLGEMRAENATPLQSYGWIDQPNGVVRLPVDRAMDLLVERGLPPVSPGRTLEDLQRARAQPQVFGQSLRP